MELSQLTERVLAFRDERHWQQFHKANHLAAGISIEAAELQEHFLWKTPEQVAALKGDDAKRAAIGDELADVMVYALLLAHELGLDPAEIILSKLAKNAVKYPADQVRGSAKKYDEYRARNTTPEH